MNLLDLLSSQGGSNSLSEMAGALGLDASDAEKLVGALSPAVTRGISRQTQESTGLDNLAKALQSGGHQRYIDEPASMRDAAATADGNKILGHIFGSKDVSRNVAAQAATQTGIDPGLIKQALPLLAGLAMSALSKHSNAGSDIGGSSGLGALGDLLGGATGGDGDLGVDDMLDLARKFF